MNKKECEGANMTECVKQYVEQQVNAVMKDPDLPSYYNDPIKAAMAEMDEIAAGTAIDELCETSDEESVVADVCDDYMDYAEFCYEKEKTKYLTEDGKLKQSEDELIEMAKCGDNGAIYLAYMESLGNFSYYGTTEAEDHEDNDMYEEM